ncbi:MAG: PTS system mannose/fructose/sorbose family transporter subunit IID, partial [Pseudomonadota bacterium]
MAINKLTLGRSLWRIFFLQAAWNYQGQQNLGFTAAVLPVLEEVYPRGAHVLTQAARRCLQPFNTQPYMAGPIVGSLLRAEEMAAAGGLDPRKLDRFK